MREARAWFAASYRAATPQAVSLSLSGGIEEERELPPGNHLLGNGRFIRHPRECCRKRYSSRADGNCWLSGVRLEPVLAEMREAFRDSARYGNLEAAAKDFIAWWEQRAPGSYEAFRARVA